MINKKFGIFLLAILLIGILVAGSAEATVYRTWCKSFATGGNLVCDTTANGVTNHYTPGVLPTAFVINDNVHFYTTYATAGYDTKQYSMFTDSRLNTCVSGSNCAFTNGNWQTNCEWNGADPWICKLYYQGQEVNQFYLRADYEI